MREERTTTRGKLAPIQKAAALIAEGRVRHEPGARVYRVKGDSGTYHVVVDAAGVTVCPCQARTPLCSHALAVIQIEQDAIHRQVATRNDEISIDDLWRRVGAVA